MINPACKPVLGSLDPTCCPPQKLQVPPAKNTDTLNLSMGMPLTLHTKLEAASNHENSNFELPK